MQVNYTCVGDYVKSLANALAEAFRQRYVPTKPFNKHQLRGANYLKRVVDFEGENVQLGNIDLPQDKFRSIFTTLLGLISIRNVLAQPDGKVREDELFDYVSEMVLSMRPGVESEDVIQYLAQSGIARQRRTKGDAKKQTYSKTGSPNGQARPRSLIQVWDFGMTTHIVMATEVVGDVIVVQATAVPTLPQTPIVVPTRTTMKMAPVTVNPKSATKATTDRQLHRGH